MNEIKDVKHIHMTAICGTAMGALAGMLTRLGYRVTGSDDGVYPPMCDYLKGLGIDIIEGFRPENLDPAPDLVIVGNTVKKVNPEAAELERRGIPFMHLPQAISEYFLKEKHPVVIAGTHGKTTTTALCAWMLESAGRDPGFLVGGILKNFGANNKVGGGEHFVIEGDEYDSAYFDKVPKMWHYRPLTAAITSVEFDHGDIYRDIDHIKEAFATFVCMIPPGGYLVACADYPHVHDVIDPAVCPVLTYGFSPDAMLRVEELELGEDGSRFTLKREGKSLARFHSPMWGAHNASNASAVAAIGMHLGLHPEQIQKSFDTFGGVKRRQEIIFEEQDIILIDDFAHHPTKVRETVKAVRARYPRRRLICIFEPRTNTSRRSFFQKDYPASFDGSDIAVVAGVFNPGQIEPDQAMNPALLTQDIGKRGIEALHLPTVDGIVDTIGSRAGAGDVILIMSNGGFDGIYHKLPARLRARTGRGEELLHK
jgi:UDP-N-acetylmuramate: L-alanyl-gamma-D-glutamyl-meso-diaminopimelate ligase